MRRIDLLCDILSPLSFSFVIYYTSVPITLLFLVLWNCVSVVPEYMLLLAVYNRSPTLSMPKMSNMSRENVESQVEEGIVQGTFASSAVSLHKMRREKEAEELEKEGKEEAWRDEFSGVVEISDGNKLVREGRKHKEHESVGSVDACALHGSNDGDGPSATSGIVVEVPEMSRNPFKTLLRGWRLYWHHDVFLASMAYVVLYFSVLSGGVAMTAYFNAVGISPLYIACWRGFCAACGMCATLVMPVAERELGTDVSALGFLLFQIVCLTPGVALFFTLYQTSFWQGIAIMVSSLFLFLSFSLSLALSKHLFSVLSRLQLFKHLFSVLSRLQLSSLALACGDLISPRSKSCKRGWKCMSEVSSMERSHLLLASLGWPCCFSESSSRTRHSLEYSFCFHILESY